MEIKELTIEELIKLLNDIDGQQKLYDKAKAGENQAMLDFVRFSVLKKICDSRNEPLEEKVKLFEIMMSFVNLKAEDFNAR